MFSCRNPEKSCDSFFFKILERNWESTPVGKLPGARPGNRAVWSSLEIYDGFKTKYASYFCPNISTATIQVTVAPILPDTSIKILSESKYKYNKATPLPSLLFHTLPTSCRVFMSPVAFVVPSHRAIHCRCCAACHAAAHCRHRVTRHFRRAARRHAARCCH